MNKIEPLDQYFLIDTKAFNHNANVQNNSESKRSLWDELRHFSSSVPDFRRNNKGNIRHRLSDIIILCTLAAMSGYFLRADIIAFGKLHLKRLRSKGLLKNGVPSQSTLFRVEKCINTIAFADLMARVTQDFHGELVTADQMMELICIDGKAMRGTTQENGRNPDIVSAYAPSTGQTLATEACREKSNEIKAVPLLLGKIDIAGKLITADAMSMQKDIIDKIIEMKGNFIIELKANQRSLRYGVEDKIKECTPIHAYTIGPEFGHGRIETRTYKTYDGLNLIVDKDKWGCNLTVVEFQSHTIKKSTAEETSETRFYISNLPPDTPWIGEAIRKHWSIESMHWSLDHNFHQDHIKRKYSTSARNLDTMQRLSNSILSAWRGRRKKRSDKSKGNAALMREISMSITKLLWFLSQK